MHWIFCGGGDLHKKIIALTGNAQPRSFLVEGDYIYEVFKNNNMARKKIYAEEKRRFTMTLTQTAIQWLEQKQIDIKASSISDVIERMARENLPKKE